MTRTQIQFPDPLYQRLKEIADQQEWSLAEVMRRAAEHFVDRFPPTVSKAPWSFPVLDCGGDFISDPSKRSEADAILQRSGL
jgi:hypothetical protein